MRFKGVTRAAVIVGGALVLGRPTGAQADQLKERTPPGAASGAAASTSRLLPLVAFESPGERILSGVRVWAQEAKPTASGARGAGASPHLEVARLRFSSGGEPVGLHLPARLGGGVLFYQSVAAGPGAGTIFYRGETWTGELTPLALLPFVVNEVTPGFDRLYLGGAGRLFGLDPVSGALVSTAPLPEVAQVESLQIVSDTEALLVAPLVGTLKTDDRGQTWAAAPAGSEAAPGDAVGEVDLPPRRRADWAVDALLSGAPLLDGSSLSLQSGQVVRLTGQERLPEIWRHRGASLLASETCQGQSGESVTERELWFVCSEVGARRTRVLRAQVLAEGTLALEEKAAFAGLARVVAAGSGGVVVATPCSGKKKGACWVHAGGQKSIALGGAGTALAVDSDRLVEVRRSADEQTLVRTTLLRSAPDGSLGVKKLYPLPEEAEVMELLRRGAWLPGASVVPEGVAFWATRGNRFVGVTVRDEEALRIGPIQTPLRRALISGSRALIWGASGFSKVTVDGGSTWSELSLPYRSGDVEPPVPESPTSSVRLGCSLSGCSLGQWIRLGWGESNEGDLPLVEVTPVAPSGPGRERYECSQVAARSKKSLPLAGKSQRRSAGRQTLPSAEPSVSAIEPFWEIEGRDVDELTTAFSVSAYHHLARINVWGPREGSWVEGGRVEILFRDPFRLQGIFRTKATRGVVASSLDAEELLGLLDQNSRAPQVALDPEGEAGVLLIGTQRGSELFAFQRDQGLSRFSVAEDLQLRGLSGAAVVKGRYFLGQELQGEFLVLEASGRDVSVRARFPLENRRGAMLTRSSWGDLAIAISSSHGTLVYPVELPDERGAEEPSNLGGASLGAAILSPHRGSRPEVCDPAARGFYLIDEMDVAPYVGTESHPLDVHRVKARLLVGYGEACLDGLAADSRGELHLPLGGPRGDVGLVVASQAAEGTRVELSCQ